MEALLVVAILVQLVAIAVFTLIIIRLNKKANEIKDRIPQSSFEFLNFHQILSNIYDPKEHKSTLTTSISHIFTGPSFGPAKVIIVVSDTTSGQLFILNDFVERAGPFEKAINLGPFIPHKHFDPSVNDVHSFQGVIIYYRGAAPDSQSST